MAVAAPVPKYNEDLRAPLQTAVSDSPKVKVHRVEWAKVRHAGEWAGCRPRAAAAALARTPRPFICAHAHTQVMAGDPVEINPSTGSGYRVMSVDEWSARFRRSEEFPACLACESSNTKEHAFTQVGNHWFAAV